MCNDEPIEQTDTEQPNYRVLAIITTASLAVILAGVFVFDLAVPNRGFGLFEPLSPGNEVVIGFWGVITQLGDPWFLVILTTVVYLLGIIHS